MSRRCDAIACEAAVAPGRFMCLKHWRLVPLSAQCTIKERYREGRKGLAFLRDPAYLAACADSIDGIAERERKTGNNTYRRLLEVLAVRNAAGSGAAA